MLKFPTKKNDTVVVHVTSTNALLAQARAKFEYARSKILELQNQEKALAVNNAETQKLAVNIDGFVKDLIKEIKARATEIVAEPDKFVKAVRSLQNGFISDLEAIRARTKRKVIDYQNFIELERRKQDKLIEEANRKLEADLKAQAKAAGVEAPTVAPMPLPKVDQKVRTEEGTTASFIKVWKHEVVDEKEVPREFCSPDKKKLDDAVKAGMREIPGVRIFEDMRMATR